MDGGDAEAVSYVEEGWLEGEAEGEGKGDGIHVLSYAENSEKGWTALQIWGFQLVNGGEEEVQEDCCAEREEEGPDKDGV